MGIFSDALGSVSGALFGDDAEEAARDAAFLNAVAIQKETEEQVRRTKYNQQQQVALAEATIRAAGWRGTGGSSTGYIEELKRVQAEEVAWIEESGLQRRILAAHGGQVAATQAENANNQNLIGLGFAAAGLYLGFMAL